MERRRLDRQDPTHPHPYPHPRTFPWYRTSTCRSITPTTPSHRTPVRDERPKRFMFVSFVRPQCRLRTGDCPFLLYTGLCGPATPLIQRNPWDTGPSRISTLLQALSRHHTDRDRDTLVRAHLPGPVPVPLRKQINRIFVSPIKVKIRGKRLSRCISNQGCRS